MYDEERVYEEVKPEESRILKERMQGTTMEIVKVLFMYSIVSEIAGIMMAAFIGDLRYTGLVFGLLIVPVISVLARRAVRNFFLFALIHIGMMALAILCLPNIETKCVAAGYIFSDIIYIYVRKTSGKNDPMSIAQLYVSFAAAVILYFACGQVHTEFYHSTIVTVFVIQVITYLVYFHQMNVHDSLMTTQESMNQSNKKVSGFNNKIILLYIGLMLLLVVMFVVLRFDLVISGIGQILLVGLKLLVSTLFRGSSSEGKPVGPGEMVDQGGGDGGPLNNDIEPAMIWLILEKIVIAVCLIAALVIIVMVLYHFYKKFMADKVEETSLGDFEETTLFVEKAAKIKKERRSLFDYFSLTNEKKVRRLYQKRIEKEIKGGKDIKNSQTVQEIRKTVAKPDLDPLSNLYEKARYSEIPITKEELKRVE